MKCHDTAGRHCRWCSLLVFCFCYVLACLCVLWLWDEFTLFLGMCHSIGWG